jgi:hypothetical protein
LVSVLALGGQSGVKVAVAVCEGVEELVDVAEREVAESHGVVEGGGLPRVFRTVELCCFML